MNTVLVYFKNSYTVVVLALVLSIVFTFISSKVSKTDSPTTKDDYLRAGILSSLVAILIVNINNIRGHLTEEVITGLAPF